MRGEFGEDEDARRLGGKRDREVTLGTFTLLAIFFGLVLVGGFIFAVRYYGADAQSHLQAFDDIKSNENKSVTRNPYGFISSWGILIDCAEDLDELLAPLLVGFGVAFGGVDRLF